MTFATRSFLSAVLVVLFALVAPSTANGQVLYGSVTGTVTDATGAAVPRAKIDAVNISTGIVHSVLSDERGNWLINNLQPGTYKVTISAPSFGTLVEQGVELEANTVRRADQDSVSNSCSSLPSLLRRNITSNGNPPNFSIQRFWAGLTLSIAARTRTCTAQENHRSASANAIAV